MSIPPFVVWGCIRPRIGEQSATPSTATLSEMPSAILAAIAARIDETHCSPHSCERTCTRYHSVRHVEVQALGPRCLDRTRHEVRPGVASIGDDPGDASHTHRHHERVIRIENRNTVGGQGGDQLPLLLGDRLARPEGTPMVAADVGHHPDARANDPHDVVEVPRTREAELYHAEPVGSLRRAHELRDVKRIVRRRQRAVALHVPGENADEQFLRGGLASASGHTDKGGPRERRPQQRRGHDPCLAARGLEGRLDALHGLHDPEFHRFGQHTCMEDDIPSSPRMPAGSAPRTTSGPRCLPPRT